ncbi:MAG TPA: transglycosylase SLT domain-containing protein [Gammaproteobacteria bacterium]|nr:transglycosylase SLT domain-containing protein [Gammaproteobacteria bacterium]
MLVAAGVRAGNGLRPHQNWALGYVTVVGTSYYADPIPDDYEYELTLAAVLMQESSLCRHKRGLDRSGYGCGQLHKRAAHVAYGKPVSVHKLRHDDALNIRLAGRYLAFCMTHMPDWERGVICYNKGPTRARRMSDRQVRADDYLASIRHRMHAARNLLADIE